MTGRTRTDAFSGLAAVFGGGPACTEVPSKWDDYCDCIWNSADPKSETGADNEACKSSSNLTSMLLAPWTEAGSKARADGAPTPSSKARWASGNMSRDQVLAYLLGPHILAGGSPNDSKPMAAFKPLIGINKLALGAGAVALLGAAAAIALSMGGPKRSASAPVSGMSRSDYVMLARTLKSSGGCTREVATKLAKELAAENPRFDKERFMTAALGGLSKRRRAKRKSRR